MSLSPPNPLRSTNTSKSCLFVRSRTALTTALSITPSYLVNPSAISGRVTDYRDWQIPLGRRFRALKIWFVLRSYGVAALRDMVRRHIALGEYFAGLIKQRNDLFEIVSGPTYALTVLRCKVPVGVEVNGTSNGASTDTELNGHDDKAVVAESKRSVTNDASNALTKKVYEAVNNAGEVFLTSSVIDGTYSIRVVSANESAEEKYLKRAFDELVKAYEGAVKN